MPRKRKVRKIDFMIYSIYNISCILSNRLKIIWLTNKDLFLSVCYFFHFIWVFFVFSGFLCNNIYIFMIFSCVYSVAVSFVVAMGMRWNILTRQHCNLYLYQLNFKSIRTLVLYSSINLLVKWCHKIPFVYCVLNI